MDEPPISRGFRSRRREQGLIDRIPPGQYVTTDFPVLSAGPTPQIDLEEWTFALRFNGWVLGEWKWAEFQALPQTTIKTDIHCVTKWSKLDTIWQGVSFDDLLKAGNSGRRLFLTSWRTRRRLYNKCPCGPSHRRQGHDRDSLRRVADSPAHGGPAGCLCHISTSGRAPNGCGDCGSWKRMNTASGSRPAITTTATPGKNRDMTAIELQARPVRSLSGGELRRVKSSSKRRASKVFGCR